MQRRAALEGFDVPTLEANEITHALGCDPLLIALHDFGGVPNPGQVIAKFITQSTERLESHGGTHLAYEYKKTLTVLAERMLQRKCIDPLWNELLAWFNDSSSQLVMLREMTQQRDVIRVSGSGGETRIAFRHDRVRKHLLVDAAISALQNSNLDEQVFSDPFFADVIGPALAHESAGVSTVWRAERSNPLALFYALQVFGEPTSAIHEEILEAIEHWLAEEGSHSRGHRSLRYEALHILAETQSSYVVAFVKKFRDKSWEGRLASLRNGDLYGGIRLCYALEPGSGAPWRDNSIEYAKAKYNARFIKELDELLCRDELQEIDRIGALRLAGHLGEHSLGAAIGRSWQSDTERLSRLNEYLWASAQCGGEHAAALLTAICDDWAALSDEPKEHGSSPRNNVVADWLSWAFWRKLPRTALTYFIHRARNDDRLRFYVMYMLHGVDDPEAVEFVARELASRLKEIEATDKFWPFPGRVSEHWERQQREHGRIMSPQSRQQLRTMWQEQTADKHLRVQSFELWAATVQADDLSLLRTVDGQGVLDDYVIRARLKRADVSAIPLLIEKIRTNDTGFWWQFARDIWSEELTLELDAALSGRGIAIEREWDVHYRTDWITADLITRLPVSTAEELLTKHWQHLHFSPYFVQTALYTATPRLLELVAQTVADCPNRAEMLKHITQHFGIRHSGHPGVTRIEQMEGLVPYLNDFDDMTIWELWELCNERGWLPFRNAHLDELLSGQWLENSGLNDELIIGELDKRLGYESAHWMGRWVDDHLANGLTVENLFRVVRKWLEARRTVKALETAAPIVIHTGKRADAEVLLAGVDGSDLAAEIVADTRYALQCRRLT
jgi:hypothetical protein